MDLTFGEQIKVLLNRENLTIKEFAELLESRTGIRCSRQNLTQKLKRDNFQEQDMRTLAAVLGYRVTISLEPASQEEAVPKKPAEKSRPIKEKIPVLSLPADCINPFTNEEYLTNTVRKHPKLEHYIQVYDQTDHAWTDVAEDYFLKFQEQKRQLMGKDYAQPIYI